MEPLIIKRPDQSAMADGCIAALGLSAAIIAIYAAVLVLVLIEDPAALFANIGTISLLLSPIVIFIAARRLIALRKSGQDQAFIGFATVMAAIWILLLAGLCLVEYLFSTLDFGLGA